jgi:hypothetical protein
MWARSVVTVFLAGLCLFALFIVVKRREQKDQRRRAVAAVVAVAAIPAGAIYWVFAISREGQAALYWILISFAQAAICIILACLHIRQMKYDASSYFRPFTDEQSEVSKSEIEGQSSFVIIVWGIYGLAALLGSVLVYFAIAQAWKPETFIFESNEGFIAALTLLIIVVSSAAVPIYTDLAKQVREQIDTFELEVSKLHRAVINVSDHANPLWSHFVSASRAGVQTWMERLTPAQVERAAHDMLFKPFWSLRLDQRLGDRRLNDVPDDVLLRFQESDRTGRYGRLPWRKLDGFHESYLAHPELEHSRRRILNNQMFQWSTATPNGQEQVRRETGDELGFADRLLRTRRLRYLGWMAQARLARAAAEGGRPLYPTLTDEYPLLSGEIPADPYANEGDELSVRLHLVPSSEDFMVALLRHYASLPTNSNSDGSGKGELEELTAEYRERAARHIERWDTSLSPNLVEACNPLDLDIAPLVADMILLQHLTVEKDTYRIGSLARFFYYAFWLTEVSEPQTRVAEIVATLEGEYIDRGEERHQVADAFDIRRRWQQIAEAVTAYVKDSDPNRRDPISEGLQTFDRAARPWLAYVQVVARLNFSKTWRNDVEELPFTLASISDKQARLLTWLVRVLGSPEDVRSLNEGDVRSLNEGDKASLVVLGLRLIGNEELDGVIRRIDDYCRDPQNARDMKNTFFGLADGAREDQVQQNFDEWLASQGEMGGTHVQQRELNLTEEFLLLTLADHKSALFNWMRAARAVETREKVASFQTALLQQRAQTKRQLGVEIIPSRHDRLVHLRNYLRFNGYTKPLQVRSIYDLEPTPMAKAAEARKRRNVIYDSYLRLVEFLCISKQWTNGVKISAEIQDWMLEQVFGSAVNMNPIPSELLIKQRRFLQWIVLVLDAEKDSAKLNDLTSGELLLRAFGLISPRIQHHRAQAALPEDQRAELSDNDYETRLNEIIQRVHAYCADAGNAVEMQNTFFGGDDNATRNRASKSYLAWYQRRFSQQ